MSPSRKKGRWKIGRRGEGCISGGEKRANKS